MKVNSPEAVALAQKVFEAYGNSWSRVREAGKPNDDGVIVVRFPPKEDETSPGKPSK